MSFLPLIYLWHIIHTHLTNSFIHPFIPPLLRPSVHPFICELTRSFVRYRVLYITFLSPLAFRLAVKKWIMGVLYRPSSFVSYKNNLQRTVIMNRGQWSFSHELHNGPFLYLLMGELPGGNTVSCVLHSCHLHTKLI